MKLSSDTTDKKNTVTNAAKQSVADCIFKDPSATALLCWETLPPGLQVDVMDLDTFPP